jgi:hypothetical protein
MPIRRATAITGTDHPAFQISKDEYNADMEVTDGTSAAPGIAHTSEPGLGLWRIGAGSEGFSGSLAIKGVRPWADVRAYGAVGNNIANDAAAIDAAVTAVQAIAAATGGGGTVYFPPGTYLYNGAGILNNPSALLISPLVLRGAGITSSAINFTGVTNSECIKLTAQSAVGSGQNYGSGVYDLSIFAPTTKDIITISALEAWNVLNVNTQGGKNVLNLVESRYGNCKNVYSTGWTGTGISFTGTTHSINSFEDVILVGTSTSTGWGFDYSTATTFASGLFFKNVYVFASGQGGFRFQKTTGGVANVFVFAEDCIADSGTGVFPLAAWSFKNCQYVNLQSCWGYNHQSNGFAWIFDGCARVSKRGGAALVDQGTGTQGSFSFLNSNDSFDISGVYCTAAGATPGFHYLVDGTQHTSMRISALPSAVGMGTVFPNNADKLMPNATTQVSESLPFAIVTSGNNTAGAFALEDGSTAARLRMYMRLNSGGTMEFLDSAWTAVILSIVNGGLLAERMQTPAFAASFTPNLDSGPVIKPGVLTNNITINAPTLSIGIPTGSVIEFHLTQNGTGGWAVTWNGVFIKTWSDAGNVLNTRSSIRFRYDGTNWLQVGAQRLWA